MEIHRKLKSESEIDFFEQYEGVVFGVLKRLNISRNHPDYDDLAQIGRLKLVDAYETYPDDPWAEESRGQFVGYAFTKIRWGIIDAIRKLANRSEKEQEWNDTFDLTLPASDQPITDKVLENEWLQEVLQPLSDKEKRLVIDLCIHRLTITAIAEKEGVSRKTIYQRRKKVKEKLQTTRYKEKGEVK